MRCPACFRKLVQGPDREFETLEEHVMCREILPLRPTWQCENSKCDLAKPHGKYNSRVFWDEMGSLYGYHKIKRLPLDFLAERYGKYAAIFSFDWHWYVWRHKWNRYVYYPWLRWRQD